ncbi:MAG: hypothetical protein WCG02_02080 [Candidatus Taylorbacteria bacterium]
MGSGEVWGAVVEDGRTVFERRNDAAIYVPTFVEYHGTKLQ